MKSYKFEFKKISNFESLVDREVFSYECEARNKTEAKKIYMDANEQWSYRLLMKLFTFTKKHQIRKEMTTKFYKYKPRKKNLSTSSWFSL